MKQVVIVGSMVGGLVIGSVVGMNHVIASLMEGFGPGQANKSAWVCAKLRFTAQPGKRTTDKKPPTHEAQ